MTNELIITLGLKAHEWEIVISALRDQAVMKKADMTAHEILDRVAHDLEEQVG
jgi:hypothetical protein